MTNEAPQLDTAPLLYNVADLATLLRISKSLVYEMHANARLPAPIRMGRGEKGVRWRADVIRRWVAANCPERREWEAMNAPKRGPGRPRKQPA